MSRGKLSALVAAFLFVAAAVVTLADSGNGKLVGVLTLAGLAGLALAYVV